MDAPVGKGWLMPHLGREFICLYFSGKGASPLASVRAALPRGVRLLAVDRDASEGAVADHADVLSSRYDATPGTTYLIRPDQHVAARWRNFNPDKVERAWSRATGHLS